MPPLRPLASAAVVYRLWFYTSEHDQKGEKGDVSICLHGTLGSVWLTQLQDCQAVSGSIFSSGSRCELYIEAEEVGSLQKVTLAYAHERTIAKAKGPDGKEQPCEPWQLKQLMVRHGDDGMVSCFPVESELRGPRALLEVKPRLVFHEDSYGNCSEAPPPPAQTGNWFWPADPRTAGPGTEGYNADEAYSQAEYDELLGAVYEAVQREEVLPLVDAAVHDLSQQRTPGTFLYECVQASHGIGPVSGLLQGSLDELRRHNAELSSRVEKLKTGQDKKQEDLGVQVAAARAQVRRLLDEKRELKKLNEQSRQALIDQAHDANTARSSTACLIS